MARMTEMIGAVVLTLAVAGQLHAVEQSDPATLMLDDLRAASAARTAAAAETAAWLQERERMQVTLDALAAETTRLRALAGKDAEAVAASDRQLAELVAAGRDLAAVRAILGAQADIIAKALTGLAATTAPGAVHQPSSTTAGAEAAFDEALRALDTSERAAASVTVELVDGEHQGRPLAVKLLRVGPLAWWSELDGKRGGMVHQRAAAVVGGKPVAVLEDAGDDEARQAIRQAIAIHEGRALPVVVSLPAPAESAR